MKKLFTLIFSLLSVIAIAQNQNNIDGKNATCGFDAIQEFLRKSDISYAEKIKALNKSFAENASATTTIYTLPIVVHVFHVGEAIGVGSNVSEAAVNTMIDNMNQQFRAQGSYNVGNDTRIQFALAKRTPNCQSTNGIVRIDGRSIPGYEANGINYQDLSAIYPYLPQTSKWPEGDYINFYVVHKITGGAAAFAWWGGDLVFGYQYLGAASHEMGHFLGMAHTFNGSSGDECPANTNPDVDGDAVNDTDPHSYNSNNCSFVNNNNPCTGQIYGNVLKNFMSYACGDRFSPRQIQKMRTWLETDRLSLTTSLGGTPPTANSTPVAACSPTFVNNFTTAYPWGIDKFTLSNLVYTSSNSSEGKYLDLTCSRQVTLQRGNTYPVEINTGFNLNNVRIYLDANNNGVFTDSELLYSSLNQTIHTGSVQMPTGALLNTPLRLRVAADVASAYGGTPPTACQMTGHPTYGVGQYEDYTVFLTCSNTPTISGISVTQPTCAVNTGTIVVTASGSGTLEYSRNNGSTWQTSNTFSGLAANSSHTIKTRLQSSPSCETAYAANAVVINPIPNAPIITANTPFLCSLENVTFTATGVPANTPLQWQRNGIDIQGATATTYTPPIGSGAAGVYRVRTGSCSSNTLTIEPSVLISTSNPNLCEGQNVTFEIANYFEFIEINSIPIWTRNGIPIDGAFGPTYTTSQAGQYSAIVPNNFNCPVPILEITPKPATPTASVTVQPSCSTSMGTIVVTAPTGANLQYSVNGSPYQTGTTFSGLTPGNYSVTVKNTISNCISNGLSLTVNSVPTAPATPTASVTVQPSCSVSTGTIVVTAPTGANLQYNFNGGTYQTSTTFAGLEAGTYLIRARNTTTGCVSNPLTLTVNTAPTTPIITANTTFLCEGSNVTFTATGIPANTPMQWQRNGIDIQGATATTYTPPFGMPGNYRVVTASCSSNVITINPNQFITTNNPNLCEGQSITFSILNFQYFIENNINPMWMRNGQHIPDAFGPTYTTSQAGIYSISSFPLSGGLPNTCPSTLLEITPKPATPTASVTVQPSCSTSTGTIVITAPTGANLQYSVNGSTYQASTTFSGLTPNTYSVTVKNTVSNCTSNGLNLTVNAVPTSPATPTASVTVQPSCNVSTGTIVVTAPTGANLQYNVNGGSYQASATFSGLSPNTYLVRVRNTTTGCVSNPLTLTVNNPPAAPVITANTTFLCEGSNVIFTATGIPANTPMQWQRNGVNIQGATGTTYTNTTGIPGNYTVATALCSSNIITINPNQFISANNPNLCEGQNITFSIINFQYFIETNGIAPIWMRNGQPIPDAFGPTYTTSQAGIYSISSVHFNPCPSNILEITPKPATPTASVTVQPSCNTPTGTIVVTAPTGANLQYSVNGSTYQSSPTFSGLTPGNYSVTVKNTVSNCISNGLSLTVNAASAPPVITTNTMQLCGGGGQNITFTATDVPANTPLQWQRNGIDIQGATGTTYSPPLFGFGATGGFRVRSGSCSSNTLTIIPFATITTSTANLCEGQSVTFEIANYFEFIEINSIPIWTRNGIPIDGAFGPTYTTSQAGQYSAIVPNNFNCPVPILEITPKPATPTASVTVQPSCNTPTGTIVVTAPTGANLQFSVNGSTYQSSPTFSGLTPDNYSVTVKNTVSNCISNGLNLTVNAASETCGTLTITPSKVFVCPNTPTTLVASGCTGTVTWTGGITGNSLTVSASTTTTYTATCAGGESSSITVNVASTTANLTVLDNINTGTQLFQTTQRINAANTIGSNIINPKPTVTYQAGQSILLQPGFATINGSVFRAEIKGCDTH